MFNVYTDVDLLYMLHICVHKLCVVRITENLRKLSIIIIIDKIFMVSGH
jgi:hypothetical protein